MRHVHNYRPVTAVRPTVYRLFSAHPGQDFSLARGDRERKCTTFFFRCVRRPNSNSLYDGGDVIGTHFFFVGRGGVSTWSTQNSKKSKEKGEMNKKNSPAEFVVAQVEPFESLGVGHFWHDLADSVALGVELLESQESVETGQLLERIGR